ncbi:L,D-transpeptidase family protein [Micromonospora narathiwatensis]|uniref:Peptidoglycan-binding (PGRP) domain of peptidoglycan hydrolases-containing protein n=1 Tax=Micromonospora narathiwatensis TaxID=299146 RepID=A0A1A8ZLG2_9ACTN|nr:L,D-transpeptidase family protein [Micromonospora narathiwatensis]SBT44715.1 Peptidoglycan-binding (PGRP) domain of peptidoglycan hydrolases-containing protein [Micromonospora narathiwatensis]
MLPVRPPTTHHPASRAALGMALLVAAGLAVPVGPASAAAPVTGATTVTSAAPVTLAAASQSVLRQGSKGTAVTTLQRRLTALHYDVGTVDGDFGPSTFHAVVAFQKVNGLTRDGIVGPRTWSALDRPVVPKPKYTHPGYSVEANLTKQVLYLAKNGTVVRVLDASSGKASTPTPTGNYTVQRRIDGWRQSDLGLLWRPNYFYNGYAVHGATSVPAYPASHGCVRVPIPAMNRLWSTIRVGTPVHIYR